MPYIYKITNNINGKIYIGKTLKTIEQRFQEHCKDSSKRNNEKRPLYSAMKKYGIENFSVSMVEECAEEMLNEREKYWIEYYKSFLNGYNATKGGDGTRFLDYELIYKTYCLTKNLKETAKICNCCVTSVKNILRLYNYNEQEIIDNGINNRLKKTSIAVAQLDKNTEEIINVFSSYRAAGRSIEKDSRHIREVCQGKRKTAYGFKWKNI